MRNFWRLTKYEYKKIFQKKMVWVMFVVLSGICFLMSSVTYFATFTKEVDGKEEKMSGYQWMTRIREEDKGLSGTSIDEAFLSRMKENPDSVGGKITDTVGMMQMEQYDVQSMTEQSLYEKRLANVQKEWEIYHLNKEEKEHFQKLEDTLTKPFIYEPTGGYDQATRMMMVSALLQTLLAAVCIPAIFGDEHSLKTDQLTLCTNLGKGTLYGVKIFTGLSFSVITSILLCLVSALPALIVEGAEGFGAPIQLTQPDVSFALTVGQVFLMMFAMCVLAGVLHGAVAMFLSEKLKNPAAPMAIIVGFLIVTFFVNVPEQYRVLSQLWDYVPQNVTSWGLLNVRMVPAFGEYLYKWQVVPVLWLTISVAVTVLGYQFYKRYQVTGR